MPKAGFSASSRTFGDSMPWSIALRIRCIKGSLSSSTISLSTSVSAPITSRWTSLSCSRATWRTMRASLSNTCPSGTIRTSRMPSCSSSRWRSNPRWTRWRSIESCQSSERPRSLSVEPRDGAAHERQLADHVHQVVQLADVHAHRVGHRAQRHRIDRLGLDDLDRSGGDDRIRRVGMSVRRGASTGGDGGGRRRARFLRATRTSSASESPTNAACSSSYVAGLAISTSRSIASPSPPVELGRYVMISAIGFARFFRSSRCESIVVSEKLTRSR